MGIPVCVRNEKYNVSKKSLLIIGFRGMAGENIFEDYMSKGHTNLFHITDTINTFIMEDLRASVRELNL